MRTRVIILVVILFMALVYQGYLEGQAEVEKKSKPPIQLDVPKPEGMILCQPQFQFSNNKETHQGTGFFVQAPGNKVAAITSAHFLDFKGAALVSADWLDVITNKSIATMTKSWGPPGNAGNYSIIEIDLTPDYLILEVEQPVEPSRVLKLDPRREIPEGERIYFPNKDHTTAQGITWVTGHVEECTAKYVHVKLDSQIQLQSQSGSPIISQSTGKVIGTLSRGADGGKALMLCPAYGISRVLNSPVQFTLTKDVIGKP